MNKYLTYKTDYKQEELAQLSETTRKYFTGSWNYKFQVECNEKLYKQVIAELEKCGLAKYIYD